MLALSGVFHIALVVSFLTVSAHKSSRRLEPVVVVDLLGGVMPQSPKDSVRREAVPKEAPPLPPQAKEVLPEAPVKKAPEPKAAAREKPPVDQMASVAEQVQKMRDEQSVRQAIEERRSMAAAREAVRGVGERMAHRIENPSSADFGSRGTARVSPEMLEFFRRLEERVRESWILPEALVRDASGLIVEMRITIEKDGRVSDARIEKGSGNVHFDESVRRAIRRASPLPIPPERLRGGEDYYEVGFRFHGTGGRG
ncbi:MAG: TonB family protein [Planctomycetes bacterium]|nr:TonB family protein [Planctomycetota bacterium]